MVMASNAHILASAEGERRSLDVLFLCSRTRFTNEHEAQLRNLAAAGIDWDRVIELAATHGTRALVYRTLSTACADVVPVRMLQCLRDEVLTSTGRNLFLLSELVGLLKTFDQNCIRTMPFKGPVLAAGAYGSVALREFHDLDILVRKPDLEAAAAVLRAAGYEEVDTSKDGDQYSRVFIRDASIVDLHWAFAGIRFFFRVDPDRLWERRVATEMAATRIDSLSVEDTLLLLCLHGAKHCWSRLAWICDVSELVGSGARIEWETLIARARAHGAERMLYVGLFLASDFLGAKLPAEICSRVSQSSVVALAHMVRSWMTQGENGAGKPLERETFYITMRERCWDRLKHLIGGIVRFALPNAHDREALRLPKGLSFLHWLIRPVRLLCAYGNPTVVLRRLMGRL
jgi:hypothetical protein